MKPALDAYLETARDCRTALDEHKQARARLDDLLEREVDARRFLVETALACEETDEGDTAAEVLSFIRETWPETLTEVQLARRSGDEQGEPPAPAPPRPKPRRPDGSIPRPPARPKAPTP